MAVTLPITYSTEFPSGRSASETFDYLCDVERAIPGNFRGLESFTAQGDSVYRWAFEKLKHSGYEFQIVLRTLKKVSSSPQKLELISVPGDEISRIHACWEITPTGNTAKVAFQAKLEVDVPLPKLMKAMIAPMAQQELSKFFDRYRDNAQKSLAA